MTIRQLEVFADSNTFSTGKIVWEVQEDKGDTHILKGQSLIIIPKLIL